MKLSTKELNALKFTAKLKRISLSHASLVYDPIFLFDVWVTMLDALEEYGFSFNQGYIVKTNL